jgi:sugar lactone lactonase YvrE
MSVQATGIDTCSATRIFSSSTSFGPVDIRNPDLKITVSAPSLVGVGKPFTVTVFVENVGTADAEKIGPTLTATPAGILVWAGSTTPWGIALAPGVSATFLVQEVAQWPGVGVLTGSVTQNYCGGPQTFKSPPVSFIAGKAKLVIAAAVAAPAGVCPGDKIILKYTVSNAGDGYAATIWLGSVLVQGTGVATLYGGTPGPVPSLAPGAAVTFTLTWTAVSAGSVTFRSWSHGYDVNTWWQIGSIPRISNPVRISDLSLGLTAIRKGEPAVGGTVPIVVTVANTSAVNALSVTVFLSAGTTGPSVTLMSSPASVSVTLLGDGDSKSFTWVYRADEPGTRVFTASANAVICGTAVSFQTPVSVRVGRAVLTASGIMVSPAAPCPGGTFLVSLTVTNTGDAAALNVTGGTPVVGGTATATLVAPPAVTGSLAAGAAVILTWQYEAGPSLGTLFFDLAAKGVDSVSGASMASNNVISDTISVSRNLFAELGGPVFATKGESFDLTVKVTNATTEPATLTMAYVWVEEGGQILSSQTGPVPAVPFNVPAGSSTILTWSYVTSGMGELKLTPMLTADACGIAGGIAVGSLVVDSFIGKGDWPVWGHDAQHTFRQEQWTPLTPPLEELWSAPGGTSPIVSGALSYWIEGAYSVPEWSGKCPPVVNKIIARRLLDGSPVWCASGAFLPAAMACDGEVVYAVNQYPVVQVAEYEARTGAALGSLAPPHGVENLTVDNGNLYVVSGTGLTIYSPVSTFTVSASQLGVARLLTAPPLVVNDAMVVIGVSGGYPVTAKLFRIGRNVGVSVPLDFLPSSGGDADYLAFDGSHIIVTGSTGSGAVVRAYRPDGVQVREYARSNSGEIYGPAFDSIGRVIVRRELGGRTSQGVTYSPSSSSRLTAAGSGGYTAVETGPLWWGYWGLLAGRSAVANGFVYHESDNVALNVSYPNPLRTIVHAVDLDANDIVWTPTSDQDPQMPGFKSPAIARGLLLTDGGHVWGPRTLDPPQNLAVDRGVRSATLFWEAPPQGGPVHHYEVYRAEGATGQIWAVAFENPAVSPPPVKLAEVPAGGALIFADRGLTPGKTYWYAVRAVTGNGKKSWFTPEERVVAGGPVVEISSPAGCAVATGLVHVRGKAYYLGYPYLFDHYEILVDGSLAYGSRNPAGDQYSGPVDLGAVTLSGLSCHKITLVVYDTDGSGASTSVTVAPNGNVHCYGCGTAVVTTFSEHRHPEGISTDSSDFVYVADSLRRRVARFDAEGRLLWEIGAPDAAGGDAGGLKDPIAAAIAGDGSLYITDKLRQQVVVYDEDGRYRFAFGGQGTRDGQFREPWGIALGPSGSLWVADRLNGRLQEFAPDGTFLKAAAGSGATRLSQPAHVWVEPSGTVWVADAGNDRVCAFDREGNPLRAVGMSGKAPGELSRPGGVAVDSDGRRLFVSDTGNDRIEVFDADAGSFTYTFGSSGTAVDQMKQPGGLALDTQTSCLYVADTLNNRGARWPLRLSAVPDWIRPRAELKELAGSPFERGTVAVIRGRAVDAHFARYRLILTGASGASVLVDSSQPVWLGILGQLKTGAFEPGGYRLDLVVGDHAGNTSQATRFLAILPKPEPLVAGPQDSGR